MKLFKTKTREQKIQHRVDRVFLTLIDNSDFEFTELEIVQISNDVRRKLNESLQSKKSDCLSKSTELVQKAKEIENAINFIR